MMNFFRIDGIFFSFFFFFFNNTTYLGKTIKYTKEREREIKSIGTCRMRHLLNCAISETPGRVIRPRVQPHDDARVRYMSRQSERFARVKEREIFSFRSRNTATRRDAISDAMI